MTTINIGKKFGRFLVNREDGNMVYDFLKSEIQSLKKSEKIFLNFDKVAALSPGFCDEVFGQIEKSYPGKVIMDKNANHALMVAFETVEETRGIKFNFGEKIGGSIY